MKQLLIILFLFISSWQLKAQIKLPVYPDSLFSTYYHQRLSLFKDLPQTKGDIIFIGNSITDGGEWSELFKDLRVKNRGISGDFTSEIIYRIDEVVKRKPAKVFLMIGVNDLSRNVSPDSVVKNILLIADYIKQESVSTQIYIQSILPVNEAFGKFGGHTNRGEQIKQVNEKLTQNASDNRYTYIDLYSSFKNEKEKLNEKFTNDGLHLTGEGYLFWKHLLIPYVFNLQLKPSLLPQPQQLKWNNSYFPLYKCKTIVNTNDDLNKEAIFLRQKLQEKDLDLSIGNSSPTQFIELKIGEIKSGQNESETYRLSVSAEKIIIEANTRHGIFNGIQTLLQLIRNASFVNTCEITDWPAFSWRGFMVDVGRNFQSIKQIKQQIDVMAAYKLNIFHFHLTEDIAWRLQSKQYPQLTDSKNMLRNQGEYYSLAEMKELINYCKERYITLIPEIDMPGHSAAFKRAMGVDMQSTEGTEICKNILTELCKEFDLPYVHIGGDEVKITNKEFLPAMVNVVKSFNKKVIAWDPGGNVPEGTLMQMWVGNAKPKEKFPAIDSRHLYLNHFDPIDGVVATFNHQVCDVAVGDKNKLGAILCNWPDRRVNREEDLIKMNAVYPVMLAFVERCWHGGGWKNYLSDISSPGNERYNAFVEFENRLLEHKALYFKKFSFPYVKQSDIDWKMVGPFANRGKTETIFAPESKSFFDTVHLANFPSLYGGTIWLRHFWSPMIGSHQQNPEDSTTWYAIRKIWSGEEGIKDFWIGFNNLSRSTATHSPPVGEWDNKNSAVWVNGKLIEPPHWKHGGKKGNSEIPLIDEGYEYREATKIFLHKGWNTILIKSPVASFKDPEWQNPVKWMFTVIPFE